MLQRKAKQSSGSGSLIGGAAPVVRKESLTGQPLSKDPWVAGEWVMSKLFHPQTRDDTAPPGEAVWASGDSQEVSKAVPTLCSAWRKRKEPLVN